MGSYKWGYKSRNMGHNYGYPTYNPLITTHEPSSRFLWFRYSLNFQEEPVFNLPALG